MGTRVTLNPPDQTHRPPNTGDGTEFGDSYYTTVNNLNTMFADIYAGTYQVSVVNETSGTAANTITAGGVITFSTLGAYTLGAPTKGQFTDLIFTSTQGTSTSLSVALPAGVTFDGKDTVARATQGFRAGGAQSLGLVGLSTSDWAILSNANSVQLATA